MAVDTRRCVGCNACVIACKTENALPEGNFRSWIVVETRGVFPDLSQEIRSERCMHCSDAPCVTNCPTGASHYGEGGTVLVDKDDCTGCKACMAACPYEARTIHPDGFADKCTFCLHRVGKGKLPACVETCPTNALTFGDLNDPTSDVAKLLVSRKHAVQKPERGTNPNVYFLS
jgi:Fe-S-cluster-containing dehydrogenase component